MYTIALVYPAPSVARQSSSRVRGRIMRPAAAFPSRSVRKTFSQTSIGTPLISAQSADATSPSMSSRERRSKQQRRTGLREASTAGIGRIRPNESLLRIQARRTANKVLSCRKRVAPWLRSLASLHEKRCSWTRRAAPSSSLPSKKQEFPFSDVREGPLRGYFCQV